MIQLVYFMKVLKSHLQIVLVVYLLYGLKIPSARSRVRINKHPLWWGSRRFSGVAQ